MKRLLLAIFVVAVVGCGMMMLFEVAKIVKAAAWAAVKESNK
jgi:hypothetical protein